MKSVTFSIANLTPYHPVHTCGVSQNDALFGGLVRLVELLGVKAERADVGLDRLYSWQGDSLESTSGEVNREGHNEKSGSEKQGRNDYEMGFAIS